MATAPVHRIFALVLGELQVSNWPPLADAAATVRRAIPHLLQPPAPIEADLPLESEEAELAAALESISDHCTHFPLALDSHHQVDRLWQAIDGCLTLPALSSPPSEHRLITTPVGPKSVEMRSRRVPLWALDLHLGKLLSRLALLPVPLPLPGSIRVGALDAARTAAGRRLAFFRSLTRTLGEVQQAFRESVNDHATLQARASLFRTTSRAPLTFALIGALGSCRTGHVQQALGVSRLGANGILMSLESAGLVLRTSRGVWAKADQSAGFMKGSDPLPSVDTQQIDEDLAELDRLLNRFSASRP